MKTERIIPITSSRNIPSLQKSEEKQNRQLLDLYKQYKKSFQLCNN